MTGQGWDMLNRALQGVMIQVRAGLEQARKGRARQGSLKGLRHCWRSG